MRKLLVLTIILFTVVLTSCTQATIDCTSKESTEASLLKMKNSLNKDQEKLFLKSFLTVSLYYDEQGGEEATKKVLHGKTADDIIAEGTRIQTIQKQERLNEYTREVDSLYKMKKEGERQIAELKKIEISNLSIAETILFDKPTMQVTLTFKNGTDSTFSDIIFQLHKYDKNDSIIETAYLGPRLKQAVKPGDSITVTGEVLNFKGNINWFVSNIKDVKVEVSSVKDDKRNTIYENDYFSEWNNSSLEYRLKEFPELKQ